MNRPVLCCLLACACAPPLESAPPWVEPVLTTPFIQSFDLSCNVDKSEWLMEVYASSWTGGGTSHWTVDGEYVETHAVASIEAAEDGTGDALSLSLAVASDWREVKPNTSTAFACSDEPNVVFYMHDFDGEPVDCRGTGPSPDVWGSVGGIDGCDTTTL